MAKPSKAAITRRLKKKGKDASERKPKRDAVKGNKKGYPGLRES